MTKPPLISVIMAAYNASAYIRAAINSILNQSEQDFELIIVNDGSTDDTEAIVKSYASDKIRYYINPENLGISKTRNRAIEMARGEYIAIADSDDISHPQRLEIQAIFLAKHPQIGVVSARIKNFKDKSRWSKKYQAGIIKAIHSPEQIRSRLIFGTTVPDPVAMIRKNLFAQHNLSYDTDLPVSQDFKLFLHLGLVTDMAILASELLLYRIHPGNMSDPSNISGNLTRTKKYATKILMEFWQNNFNVEVNDIFDEFFQVKNINQFAKLNTVVETILREKINDPRYDTEMLRKSATAFLYSRLRSLKGRTQNRARYAAYKQSTLLHRINIGRKLRLYLKALLFPSFGRQNRSYIP